MRPAVAVWGNDARSVVRDRTVAVLALVPLVFLVVLRVGVPLLELQVPAAAAHTALMLGVLSVMAALFPAFMLAFLMLDERDQGLLPALRVLPVPVGRLLAYRLAGAGALSFAYPLVLILLSGVADRPLPMAVLLAGLCALASPAATLLVVAVAGNKIEGLTAFKGLFFVVGLAAVGVAVSEPWSWALAVLPPFWVYAAFVWTGPPVAAASAVAVASHAALIVVAYRRFAGRLL